MNILSAIFTGRMGFLKAVDSVQRRAERIATSAEPEVNDLVGLKIDKAFAEANTRSIRQSDDLLSAFIRDSVDKKS